MSDQPDQPDLSPRAQREQRFYDLDRGRYGKVRGWITKAIGEFARDNEMHTYYDPKDKTILDYGCGGGRLSLRLLEQGAAHVTGIDVSEVRLNEARDRAASNGFGDRVMFLVADAHATGFPNATFDLVVGSDVLHHLDLTRAIPELRRILKPGGRAVFVEPLAHNPILRAGRALTPSARTPDEHPLTITSWKLCASVFSGFRHYEREFLTIPLMPLNLLLPRSGQRKLAHWMRTVDDRFLARYPSMRRHARISILVLE
jgi:ubiquinone/menaquinone biosynthesis C-methylase UbiE